MLIHNWSVAPPGLFHHFRQHWSTALCDQLNDGLLPANHFALLEQSAARFLPDILTLHETDELGNVAPDVEGEISADAAPKIPFVSHRTELEEYAIRANRVVVRTTDNRLVAAIEIVSPGNKATARAIQTIVGRSVAFLAHGVSLLLIDLFPPTARDPHGLHPLIWHEVVGESFMMPAGKPLTVASYTAGPPPVAYVEPLALDSSMPDMPLFIAPEVCVRYALESTYSRTWEKCPRQFRDAVTR